MRHRQSLDLPQCHLQDACIQTNNGLKKYIDSSHIDSKSYTTLVDGSDSQNKMR